MSNNSMSTQHKPGQWWNAPTAETRRALYYRCMREIYEFPAVEALAHTRRMFALMPDGDLIGNMRAAITKATGSTQA